MFTTLTECESGEYGPGCTQTCHCQDGECDIYSGICKDSLSCETGWSGENCQSRCHLDLRGIFV